MNDAGQCSIARKGIYSYQDKTYDCSGTVNIGCQTPNEITIETSCSKESQELKKGNIGTFFINFCLFDICNIFDSNKDDETNVLFGLVKHL